MKTEEACLLSDILKVLQQMEIQNRQLIMIGQAANNRLRHEQGQTKYPSPDPSDS